MSGFELSRVFQGLHVGGKLVRSVDSVSAGKRHDALKLDSCALQRARTI